MSVKLKKINYKEKSWTLKNLTFLNNFNLIVGKNAVGKTRSTNVISNLARNINQKNQPMSHGIWELEFETSKKTIIKYNIEVENKGQTIVKEEIFENDVQKLKRKSENAEVFSEIQKKYVVIKPPFNKLVLHVRRDIEEYPFFEHLINWSENMMNLNFGIEGKIIEIPSDPDFKNLDSLKSASYVFEKISEKNVKNLIKDFNSIGYEIESVKTKSQKQINIPNFKMLFFREKGIEEQIDLTSISSGMMRAFALLVFVHYFIEHNNASGMLLIDDIGEGLDYERSTKLIKLLLSISKKYKNLQFIFTTNDSFLMNSVDVENWNILFRDKTVVQSKNYQNSKAVFDEFKNIGLNNFDLFSSDIINKLK